MGRWITISEDIGVIPSSSRLMTASLVSGSVTGKEAIVGRTRDAIKTGIFKAAAKTYKEEIRDTVPKDTGRLRRRVGIKVNQAANKATGKYKITLKWLDMYTQVSEKSTHYAKYHTREHPEFRPNQNYKGGKEAISVNRIMSKTRKRVLTEVNRELNARGLSAR